MLDAAVYLDHVRSLGERLAAAGESREDVPVPSMPGTTVGALLDHAGAFCRFVHSSLGSQTLPDLDFSDRGGDPLAWFRQEFAVLLSKLESADFEAPNWSWGRVQQAKFWFRRAAQELAVHCWDAENAGGEPGPVDPALAADGVDEFVDEFCAPVRAEFSGVMTVAERFGGSGETFHLHATDTEGEWLLRTTPDAIEVTREHAKGDVAARGTASDLLLLLWGRVPPSTLEVFGDASLLDRWQQRVQI